MIQSQNPATPTAFPIPQQLQDAAAFVSKAGKVIAHGVTWTVDRIKNLRENDSHLQKVLNVVKAILGMISLGTGSEVVPKFQAALGFTIEGLNFFYPLSIPYRATHQVHKETVDWRKLNNDLIARGLSEDHAAAHVNALLGKNQRYLSAQQNMKGLMNFSMQSYLETNLKNGIKDAEGKTFAVYNNVDLRDLKIGVHWRSIPAIVEELLFDVTAVLTPISSLANWGAIDFAQIASQTGLKEIYDALPVELTDAVTFIYGLASGAKAIRALYVIFTNPDLQQKYRAVCDVVSGALKAAHMGYCIIEKAVGNAIDPYVGLAVTIFVEVTRLLCDVIRDDVIGEDSLEVVLTGKEAMNKHGVRAPRYWETWGRVGA